MEKYIKITECPRDAMQGISTFIPTDIKITYINKLINCGFDIIDFGSFVSSKAVPQMRDTEDVLHKLDLGASDSQLLAIVANKRGAFDASRFDEISYIGFPFSISETFQQRNTNASIEESLKRAEEIQDLCEFSRKRLVLYVSMAFGNPYGDPWDAELAADWVEKLSELGITIFSLSDTTAVAQADSVSYLFSNLIKDFSGLEFGAHFHTTSSNWRANVEAAYKAGCRRFDTALKGYGGCPMAADELTGNLATENLLTYCEEEGISTSVNAANLLDAMSYSEKVFAEA